MTEQTLGELIDAMHCVAGLDRPRE